MSTLLFVGGSVCFCSFSNILGSISFMYFCIISSYFVFEVLSVVVVVGFLEV